MGLIRVSDGVEERLKRASGGRSMSATIDSLLDDRGGLEETPFVEYIDKKFEELKALITDNLVDVVAQSNGGGRAPGEKEWVPWDQMSYIIFTHDDDDPAWIIPASSVFELKNGDPTVYSYYVKDNTIFMESVGRPEPLLKVTPEIREAIDKHFTYTD